MVGGMMAKKLFDTPFEDAICTSVPEKGTGSGEYDKAPMEGIPGRDGGLIKELTYDSTFAAPKFKNPGETMTFLK
jgi:hypothetical protein